MYKRNHLLRTWCAVRLILVLVGVAGPVKPGLAQPAAGSALGGGFSCDVPEGACPDYDCLKQAYFGDLHIHTAYSLDSYVAANRNTPLEAYAFARGGVTLPIGSGEGQDTANVTLQEPLDFAAVTDHSEFFSIAGLCLLSDQGSPACRAYQRHGSLGQQLVVLDVFLQSLLGEPRPSSLCTGNAGEPAACVAAARTTWDKVRLATESANERCQFTAFPAYEWTAQTLTANLHRNVIFANENVPEVTFDYVNYSTPLELWRALDSHCSEAEGCDVVTIPHNSNFSDGQMWSTAEDPEALDYMERYQVAVEIYQHKGASECLPEGPYGDAACDFELVHDSNLVATLLDDSLVPAEDANPQSYIRNALAAGLTQLQMTGQNPLEMGFIGSTDTHNGTSGYVDEANWAGHLGIVEDTAEERLTTSTDFSPGGLAGVWAEENSRAAIFSAIKRREIFATSGPRIQVRLYAVPQQGLASKAALCEAPDFPANVLARGAKPMGARAYFDRSPTFLVAALAYQQALSTIEIIKMTSNEQGLVRLHVYREVLPPEMQNAPCITWRDADYDPSAPALYYARVLEQPTPRWSAYDCRRNPSIPTCDAEAEGTPPQEIQERAWTSPIFIRP